MQSHMTALLAALALPQFGLTTVFLVAFVSATLLPLGSEPAVFGLVKLNPDGTVFKDAQGNTVDTYAPADIAGLSKVFTGWSFSGPDTTSTRFYGGGTQDVARMETTLANRPRATARRVARVVRHRSSHG